MEHQEYQEYLDKKKKFYNIFLNYTDDKDNSDEAYHELTKFITSKNYHKNKEELKFILYLISKISNHHHRYPSFDISIMNIH